MSSSSSSEYAATTTACASPSGSRASRIGGEALGHDLDDDAPPIGRVGRAPHVAGLLEAVEHARDRAGRQVEQLGEATRGDRVAVDEQLERLDVRLGQAQADGDRLPEDLAVEVDLAERADDRVDRGITFHLTAGP